MRVKSLLDKAIFASALALAAPVASAQIVLCESDSQRTRYCDVDTRGGVRLVKQHSRAPCIEGRTWGYDRRGVWVSAGCRAEFERDAGRHAYRGNGYESPYVDRVRCESVDQRVERCPIPGGRGGARIDIDEQLSRAPCRFGSSWGYDRRAIWVADGCRAEFVVRR